MAELGKSFWGNPTYRPKDEDVSSFVDTIRELAGEQTDERALKLCTSAMHAIVAYVVERFRPKEALALLDKMRIELIGAQHE